ncbi:MAG: hypothetical protein JWL64_149 [Frankiales bacterium]|nr:hypothetical protein [Frankiales bacterium]
MQLFVNALAGGPLGYPMTGVWAGGAVWFTTYRKAAKVRHLLADGRVCCLFSAPSTEVWTEPAVAVTGTARLSDDVRAFSDPQGESPLPVAPGVRTKVADRLQSGLRVVFEVSVESVRLIPVPVDGAAVLACHVAI